MNLTDIEKMEAQVEALRSFKETDGYKALCAIVEEQFNACVLNIIKGDPENLERVRADMQAWSSILELVDHKISVYDSQKETFNKMMLQGGR